MFENIGKSLQKLFGSKQEKDILKFNPIIEQIHQFGDSLKNLSHDELRQKTTEFRERISDYLSDIDDAIENLRQQTIDSEELSDKENLFLEIDTLKKQRDQELEVILNEILPEAFAVVKETAIRFKNNSTLSVTATEHDKNLAVQSGKSYVSITGNQATWKNQWRVDQVHTLLLHINGDSLLL
jgi:preprotein translocase subunit SecA